jgi:hypothetical protein
MRQYNRVATNAAPAWTESAWPFSSMSNGQGNSDPRPDFKTSGVTTPAVNIIETPVDMRVEISLSARYGVARSHRSHLF